MAIIYNKSRVRLKLDLLSFDSPCDILRSNGIKFRRCNDIAFELGIFHGQEWVEISNFASINLSISEMNDTRPPSGEQSVLLHKSISEFNLDSTLESWNLCESCHAVINISADENSISAGEYWMCIWAETNENKIITLGSGICSILETGGVDFMPPDPKNKYYTQMEIDELFIRDEKLDDYYTKSENDLKFSTKEEVAECATMEFVDENFVRNEVLSDEYLTANEIQNTYAKNEQFSNYYTKSENDNKFVNKTEIENFSKSYVSTDEIKNYYTKSESDEKYALKGESGAGNSSDLSSCLLKSENLSDLESIESARENLGLGNIATQNSNEISISGGEISGVTINSAVTSECEISDSTFSNGEILNSTISGGTISGISALAIADGGTGANEKFSAFNNLSPLSTKGDLLVCTGTGNIALSVGANDQVLVADSTSATGVKWATINVNSGSTSGSTGGSTSGGNSGDSSIYGWKLLHEINIADTPSEIIFDKKFDYENFTNYRLAINNLCMSDGEARVHLRMGENVNGTTTWSETSTQYLYNTFDYVNSMNRSGSYSGTDPYFSLGHATLNYRYRHCPLNGYFEIFNSGSSTEDVHLTCHLTYVRFTTDGYYNKVGSWYFMSFRNINSRSVSGMKFYPASGTFTAGRLRLFGMY